MEDEAQRLAAYYRGRTVLVTGAYGFIGHCVSESLARAGANVRRLHRRPLHGRSTPGVAIEGDSRDPRIWERILSGVDAVVHLAAQTSAKASEVDPEADYAVNVEATRKLVDACRASGNKVHVLFAGTVTQKGRTTGPLSGAEPDEPISTYDLHKLIAEKMLEFHAHRGTILATTLRLPTVYGPGGREGSPDCGVVNAFVRQALAGEPLTIYGNGDRVRDFVFVEDVARAFLLAGLSVEHCNGRHFLVGSGAPTTVADLVQLIASIVEREAGRTVPVMHIEPPPDEPEIAKCNFSVDPTALERATGFRPSVSLEAGLTRTIRCFLKTSHPGSEKRE